MNSTNIFPRSLQYLIAVAEHGNFTRAAEALYVSQPTLSQQIKKLEESLQSILLNRSGRTIELTDTGKIYLRHVRRAWKELDVGMSAIHDVKDLKCGLFRLGWTPLTDHLTCRLLESFNSHYPNITSKALEMPQNKIELAIIEDDIDVGIVFSNKLSSKAQSSELEIYTLFEESLCLAVGNGHPHARKKETINLQELRQESLALLDTNFILRQHVDRYCSEHGIIPYVAIEANSLSVIIEIVQTGSLATVLPESIICTQHGLHSIVPSPKLPRKAVSMLYRKGDYKSYACLAFIKLAHNWTAHRHD